LKQQLGCADSAVPLRRQPYPSIREAQMAQNTETAKNAGTENKQLLHLVFGGELKSLDSTDFKDPTNLDIVGIYPNYETARRAWKSKAQQTVDQAQMRYFIVHMHRLLDPETDKH
jgi:Domain of unknown function (DUF4170)